MIKQTTLTKAIDEAIALKLKAIDMLIDKLVLPLADVGSPEALIGKSYEQWTPEDLMFLSKIYGSGGNTPLSNLIFKKEYEKVRDLEQDEVQNA